MNPRVSCIYEPSDSESFKVYSALSLTPHFVELDSGNLGTHQGIYIPSAWCLQVKSFRVVALSFQPLMLKDIDFRGDCDTHRKNCSALGSLLLWHACDS
jgi:hypothetical protein